MGVFYNSPNVPRNTPKWVSPRARRTTRTFAIIVASASSPNDILQTPPPAMLATTSALLATATLLTNCVDVTRAVFAWKTDATFCITGAVRISENYGNYSLLVADASGGAQVFSVHLMPNWQDVRDGDTVCIQGAITRTGLDFIAARAQSLRVLRHAPPAPPVAASVAQLKTGLFDCRSVHLTGRLVEVFRDEIDSRYVYASLDADGEVVYLAIPADDAEERKLRAQRGATITATGTVLPTIANARRTLVRTLGCAGLSAIRVVRPAPEDPFSVPPLEAAFPPSGLTPARERRRLAGLVTAAFDSRRLLLRTDVGQTHNVCLASASLPPCGTRIEVVGLPETDLYRINLTDADWRPAPGAAARWPDPEPVTLAQLLTDRQGRPQINPWHHGRLIRVEGTVIDQPVVGSVQKTVILKDGELLLPVDLTSAGDALARLAVGCRAAVVGTCIVKAESWRPFAAFPHASGLLLAPRTADDVAVLARPPWWTPRLLLAVTAASLALAFLILVWNRTLQAIINRKSRQLLREKTAKITSDLRAAERTALAIELHDALSQNLSGVACQVAATTGAVALGPEATRAHLETAARMLLSCRTELRRCLRDLRSDALEEKDFSAAVRKVLAPVAIGVETSVRFNVPRALVSDSTAHAILCVVRELVANAIRHGKARHVWVAGECQGCRLSFSVQDDGCGFDPRRRPGPVEGHFGLEGVRERIKRLGGTIMINARPGAGARVTAVLRLTPPSEKGKER